MGITHGKTLRLYLTESEPCSYIDGLQQRMLVVDPLQAIDMNISTQLSQKGFRRSGNMIYRPNCNDCKQCVSVRLPVSEFKPSKSQRRVAGKNKDLEQVILGIEYASTFFDLYLKYQKVRHPDGVMCNPNVELYKSFIESDVSSGYLLVMQNKKTKKPVSVTVVDVFKDGISGVYTFFDPDYSDRSLGTNAVLEMIEVAKEQQLPYVYLGFWIKECQKMNYKTKFKPIEGYINDKWQTIS